MMNATLSSHLRPLALLHHGEGAFVSRNCVNSPLECNCFVRWNPLANNDKRRRAQVVRSSLGQIPEPEHLDFFAGLVQSFVGSAEGLLYTLADAAVATDAVSTEAVKQKQDGGWLGGITNVLESFLKFLKDGLEAVHVPYAYGFAIILLTVLVKAATFPLTKQQVESTMAIQTLQPKIKDIQQKYAGNQEMIQLETARLYKQAGVNPLAGCLPTLATIPVWIGLYRALSNVADEGLLTEGFFWIPSLAGPTTIAARQNGSGISWLFPFVDGHPPLGWSDTLVYLVLPVLLVGSQYISTQIMQPPQANDPSQKNTQAILKFLPLMIGYFSLSVPSGLSLYWLTNNILSTAQQVWLRKLGGAKPVVLEDIDLPKSTEVSMPSKSQPKFQPVADPRKPAPGERFKQLKAEEERKRKEREDSAMQQGEAASKSVDVAGSNHMDSTQGAKESQNLNMLQGAGDAHNEDEAKRKEQTSNSFVEKDSVGDMYIDNGNGASSIHSTQSRNEQSKQRGAS
uniref:Membrane insertase YidC/Oxa/ALB C-terminal domain-containing protein n=1 Tax=Araucaria cunninghamii TaxID=56994 RepID=A0A0D6R1B8_ARACU